MGWGGERAREGAMEIPRKIFGQSPAFLCVLDKKRWLGSRVVSVLDSGAEGPGFKSQSRPGPATGGEVDAACIQFDLGGGETIPPP